MRLGLLLLLLALLVFLSGCGNLVGSLGVNVSASQVLMTRRLAASATGEVHLEQHANEVKVVFEGVGGDVERFRSLAPIGYLSPLWSSNASELAARMRRCAEYVQSHPHWRMTAQLHKVAGVP